jgi:hypothetical protein
MKDFDKKWQTVAQRARQSARPDETTPLGFSTRVLAQSRQPQGLGPEVLWMRLALRVLTGAVSVLIVCALLELPHFRDRRPLDPGLENTVAQIVWSL